MVMDKAALPHERVGNLPLGRHERYDLYTRILGIEGLWQLSIVEVDMVKGEILF
uniref:Uncharacterized protein n=1 Tax=Candidatus Kentrum sp. TC TaxID=2126339 RepID=A0A451A5S5_9GAMM|nr:MAG: hypothetical protein BECKTC1821D_GA0114238_105728 [Candidatus Kentron sp. TC]VFK61378.1 MAG: hypothetical protein BECKTC1821F_GA0114240_105729 [Candidatus Kentron sp. TC]